MAKMMAGWYCPSCGLRYLKDGDAPWICYWHLQVFNAEVLLVKESKLK